MRRGTAAVLLLAVATAAPLARAQTVDGLVRDLLGERAPAAGVEVEGRIERDREGAELVVALTAAGGARLVADPGVQLVALPGSAGHWAAVDRIERVGAPGGYFESPLELRVPVAAGASGEASAEIAYAWCVVERICLFGHAVVTVPLADADG
jgi:hypothetical protein